MLAKFSEKYPGIAGFSPDRVGEAFRKCGKSNFLADMLGMDKTPGSANFESISHDGIQAKMPNLVNAPRRETLVTLDKEALPNYDALEMKLVVLFAHAEALLDDEERTRMLATDPKETQEYLCGFIDEGLTEND